MAYKTEELKEKALEKIKSLKLIFFSEVMDYLGIASSTFYDHFPSNSSDYKEMEDALRENKVEAKVLIRNKWMNSDSPQSQLYLYKLVASDDERRRLSIRHTENVNKNENTEIKRIDVSKLPDDVLAALDEAISEEEEGDEG
jgi:hypothetical protein